MNDDGSFSEPMLKRLTKTLEVEKDYDKIVCCGGVANEAAGVSEAGAMEKYLVEHGVDSEKIIKEDRSTTTKENAIYSKDILEKLGVKQIALLTSRNHMYRIYLNPKILFRKFAKVKIKKAITC